MSSTTPTTTRSGLPGCWRWAPARRSSRARRDASRSSETATTVVATRSRSHRSSRSRASGSGDCFLAGYVAARYEGGSARECLAYGVACGAESTQHFGAGSLDPKEVERILPRVQVRELDVPAGVG